MPLGQTSKKGVCPMLCEYGCGNEAKYQITKKNKWCCSKNREACPRILSKVHEKLECIKCHKLYSKSAMKQHQDSCQKYCVRQIHLYNTI